MYFQLFKMTKRFFYISICRLLISGGIFANTVFDLLHLVSF